MKEGWKGTKLETRKIQEIIEILAKFIHDITWSGWMKYQKSLEIGRHYYDETAKHILITHETANIDRWERQMNTAYVDLPEKEKESDRELARKLWEVIK